MQKQILLTFFCTLLLASASHGQHLNWYKQLAKGGTKSVSEITNDPAGNLYVFGHFTGTVDFDPGPGGALLTAGSGGNSAFLQKLTPEGQFLWVRQLGGATVDSYDQMGFDANGNAYILNLFTGTVDFDPGPGEAPLSADPGGNVALTKLDSDGNFVWGKRFDLKLYFMAPAIGPQGNISIAWLFSGTADFEPGPGVTTLAAAGSNPQTAVCTLDSNGNLVWVGAFSGSENRPQQVATDPTGTIYVQGVFNGTVDFDFSANAYSMTASNSGGPYYNSLYFVQLTPDGQTNWGRQINSTVSYNNFFVGDLKADAQGNVLSCGHFFGADFDPGPGTLIFQSPAGNIDLFCLKLTDDGDLAWAKQIGGGVSANETAIGLALDQYGSCYVTGYITEQVDLDPGPTVFLSGPKMGGYDCFVLKLDTAGVYQWSRRFGGKGSDVGYELSVDLNQQVCLVGSFTKVADFGENPGDDFLHPVGAEDYFVLKLEQGLIFDGFAFWDLNDNQLRDTGEPGVPNLLLTLSDQTLYATTNVLGRYTIYTNIVGDTLRPVLPRPYWIIHPTFALPDSTHTDTNFAVTLQPGIRDVSVVASHLNAFRPGFKTSVFVTIENQGSVVLDSVPVVVDSFHLVPAAPIFISAVPPPAVQTPEKILWYTGPLQPHLPVTYKLVLETPTSTLVGQPLDFRVSAALAGDVDSTTNEFIVNTVVRASLDPNDKQVYPTAVPVERVDSTRLQYVIRFQNTGTLPAEFVILRDTLPASLDLTSLQVLNASHPFTWRLRGENIFEVRFDSIFLPTSSSNLDASQGFVAFSLRPRQQYLSAGDTVPNRAGIYFDYNSPVITNVAHTVVSSTSAVGSPRPGASFNFTLSPNPVATGAPVWLELPERTTAWQVTVEDLRGVPVQVFKSTQTGRLYLEQLPAGVYVVSVYAGSAVRSKLLVVE